MKNLTLLLFLVISTSRIYCQSNDSKFEIMKSQYKQVKPFSNNSDDYYQLKKGEKVFVSSYSSGLLTNKYSTSVSLIGITTNSTHIFLDDNFPIIVPVRFSMYTKIGELNLEHDLYSYSTKFGGRTDVSFNINYLKQTKPTYRKTAVGKMKIYGAHFDGQTTKIGYERGNQMQQFKQFMNHTRSFTIGLNYFNYESDPIYTRSFQKIADNPNIGLLSIKLGHTHHGFHNFTIKNPSLNKENYIYKSSTLSYGLLLPINYKFYANDAIYDPSQVVTRIHPGFPVRDEHYANGGGTLGFYVSYSVISMGTTKRHILLPSTSTSRIDIGICLLPFNTYNWIGDNIGMAPLQINLQIAPGFINHPLNTPFVKRRKRSEISML